MNVQELERSQGPLPMLTEEPLQSIVVLEAQPLQRLTTLSPAHTWRVAVWRLSDSSASVASLHGKLYVTPCRMSTGLLWLDVEALPGARRRRCADRGSVSQIYNSDTLEVAGGVKRRRDEEDERRLNADSASEAATEELSSDGGQDNDDQPALQHMLESVTLQDPSASASSSAPALASAAAAAAAAATEARPEPGSSLPSDEVLARPPPWGVFRFSRKQPRAGGGTSVYGAYEVLLKTKIQQYHLRMILIALVIPISSPF